MFNKPAKLKLGERFAAKTDGLDAGNGRKSPKVASLVTNDLTIDGNISGEGELHVDCTIRGNVSVARLSVGETGRIEGAVTAEAVEIHGWVVGSITARQIRLHASAHVDGDLTHESLTIEPGAQFDGRSQAFHRPPSALTLISQDD
jgi:cytoskeletal protein CcmA (bactofilin family)